MSPFLAMLALPHSKPPSLIEAGRKLREQFPGGPTLSDASQKGNVATFHVGGAAAAVTLIPMPIDRRHLEGPVTCAWYWPEAAEALEGHESHLLVLLLDDERKPVERSILLTQITSALAAANEAAGVFWGPGRLVHPPAAFLNQSRQMAPDDLPLHLWVDFRVEEAEGGSLRLFTTGLEALHHKELESSGFRGSPQDLRAAVYNIAHYALTQTSPLNDGNTIATPSGRNATVRHAASFLADARPVIRLEFE